MAKVRAPSQPGEILLKEYLEPAGVSIGDFAKHIGLTEKVLTNFIESKTKINMDKAYRLAKATGTPVEFWLNLQQAVDVHAAKSDKELAEVVRGIKKFKFPAKAA